MTGRCSGGSGCVPSAPARTPEARRARLAARLAERARAGLARRLRVAESPAGPERVVDGRRLVSFASNDYLGLAADPRVAAALARAAGRWGAGAGAAHLLGGHTAAHAALEEALAEWTGRERALLFSTGYMANLAVVGVLAGRGETVHADRLDHASLLDAARLSGARLRRYPHGDAAALARRLAADPRAAVVATDGVFSMDGDLAPLPALAAACARAGAWLVVDDAHGLGVVGPDGRGTVAHHGLGAGEVPVLVGTLGKALGTFGAFAAGDADVIEALVQWGRSYVYTTAPPPALAEATREALRIARAEPWRRERALALARRFREGARALGLPLLPSPTPIQPVLAGGAARALALSRALEAAGFHVPAVRPPTVPEGSARLRVSLSAAHTEAQVDALLEALARAWRATGGGDGA